MFWKSLKHVISMMNIQRIRRTIVLSIRGALIKWIDPTWTNHCFSDTELLKKERALSGRGTENSCIILVAVMEDSVCLWFNKQDLPSLYWWIQIPFLILVLVSLFASTENEVSPAQLNYVSEKKDSADTVYSFHFIPSYFLFYFLGSCSPILGISRPEAAELQYLLTCPPLKGLIHLYQ